MNAFVSSEMIDIVAPVSNSIAKGRPSIVILKMIGGSDSFRNENRGEAFYLMWLNFS